MDRAESAKGARQNRMPFAQRSAISLDGSERRRVRLGINSPVEPGTRQQQKRMSAQRRVRKRWPLGYFFQERFGLLEPDLTQKDLRIRKIHRIRQRCVPLRLLLRTVRCGTRRGQIISLQLRVRQVYEGYDAPFFIGRKTFLGGPAPAQTR